MRMNRTSRLAAIILTAAGAAWAAGLATAIELPNPRLSAVWPPGATIGTSVDVTIEGDDLDEVTEIVFSLAGVAVEPLLETRPFADEPEPFTKRFRVSIPAETAAGFCEVRARGRFGLSSPRSFAIDDRPQVDEVAGNHTAAKALPLPLETVVNGRADGGAVDHYQVELAAGDRVTVLVTAKRLDSRLVAVLEVRDPEGRQIGFGQATRTREPTVPFTATTSGPYTISVRDVLYAGGASHPYRLVVSRRPHVDFVWPPVAEAGRERRHTLYGHNLPGGRGAAQGSGPLASGLTDYEAIDVTIAAPPAGSRLGMSPTSHRRDLNEIEVEGFEFCLPSDQGPANPVFIALTSLPLVEEREANDVASGAQEIVPPCEVVGTFFGQRDDDWFRFISAPGRAWWVEVISERLRLPTDPAVWIGRPAEGQGPDAPPVQVATQDERTDRFQNQPFDRPSYDPALSFVAADEGGYLVRVWDHYAGSLAHPRHVYRLIVQPAEPDFQLVATCKALVEYKAQRDVVFPANPLLRRGGTQSFIVQCYRRGGFTGPVMIFVDGLPEGVACEPVELAPDEHQVTLVLSAAADAPAWRGPIRIVGRASAAATQLERTAAFATTVWNKNNRNDFVEARLLPDLWLAVIEEVAPVITHVVGAGPWQAAPGASVAIPIVVEGTSELRGSAAVEVRGLPSTSAPYPQLPRVVLDKQASHNRFEGTVELKIPAKMPPGRYAAHLVAQIRTGYERNPEAAGRAAARRDAFTATLERLRTELTATEQARDETARQVADLAGQAEGAAADVTAAKEAAVQAAERAKAAATTLQKAQDEQKALAKIAGDLAEAAKPRDVEVFVSSPAFFFEVVAPPDQEKAP